MFGLFKSKRVPQEPVEIAAGVEIARSVEDVYALIDWADPLNAKRQTGNRVERLPGDRDKYVMTMPTLPDLKFHLDVIEAEPSRLYVYDCVVEPGIGNLVSTRESYELEAREDGGCVVVMVTEALFADGLREREFANEVAMMSAGVQSSVQKLKLIAEHGAEVAAAVEDRTLL